MSALEPGLRRSENGLACGGDIQIIVGGSDDPLFSWPGATAFSLIVEKSLRSEEEPVWQIHSLTGFSTCVLYGRVPALAVEDVPPTPLVSGERYFVSVYAVYPRFGFQQFIAE